MAEVMNGVAPALTPRPDPTALTTEALTREVKALKDLLELRIENAESIALAADQAIRDTIILHQGIIDERFEAVRREMQLVEDSRVEQKQDALASLAAALSAAKEAVKEQTTASALSINKSENATNEQLKQLNVTFTLAIEGVNRTIADLKERISKTESASASHITSLTGESKGTDKIQPWLFGIVMALVAVASIIIQLAR